MGGALLPFSWVWVDALFDVGLSMVWESFLGEIGIQFLYFIVLAFKFHH